MTWFKLVPHGLEHNASDTAVWPVESCQIAMWYLREIYSAKIWAQGRDQLRTASEHHCLLECKEQGQCCPSFPAFAGQKSNQSIWQQKALWEHKDITAMKHRYSSKQGLEHSDHNKSQPISNLLSEPHSSAEDKFQISKAKDKVQLAPGRQEWLAKGNRKLKRIVIS